MITTEEYNSLSQAFKDILTKYPNKGLSIINHLPQGTLGRLVSPALLEAFICHHSESSANFFPYVQLRAIAEHYPGDECCQFLEPERTSAFTEEDFQWWLDHTLAFVHAVVVKLQQKQVLHELFEAAITDHELTIIPEVIQGMVSLKTRIQPQTEIEVETIRAFITLCAAKRITTQNEIACAVEVIAWLKRQTDSAEAFATGMAWVNQQSWPELVVHEIQLTLSWISFDLLQQLFGETSTPAFRLVFLQQIDIRNDSLSQSQQLAAILQCYIAVRDNTCIDVSYKGTLLYSHLPQVNALRAAGLHLDNLRPPLVETRLLHFLLGWIQTDQETQRHYAEQVATLLNASLSAMTRENTPSAPTENSVGAAYHSAYLCHLSLLRRIHDQGQLALLDDINSPLLPLWQCYDPRSTPGVDPEALAYLASKTETLRERWKQLAPFLTQEGNLRKTTVVAVSAEGVTQGQTAPMAFTTTLLAAHGHTLLEPETVGTSAANTDTYRYVPLDRRSIEDLLALTAAITGHPSFPESQRRPTKDQKAQFNQLFAAVIRTLQAQASARSATVKEEAYRDQAVQAIAAIRLDRPKLPQPPVRPNLDPPKLPQPASADPTAPAPKPTPTVTAQPQSFCTSISHTLFGRTRLGSAVRAVAVIGSGLTAGQLLGVAFVATVFSAPLPMLTVGVGALLFTLVVLRALAESADLLPKPTPAPCCPTFSGC